MATPKQISVNGVPFTRSKNGNLIRTKAIKQGSVKQNHQCQDKWHSELSNNDQQTLENQRQDKTLQTLHIDGYLTFPNHSAKK